MNFANHSKQNIYFGFFWLHPDFSANTRMQKHRRLFGMNKMHLIRQFRFKDFVEAFGFISQVAALQEQMNHHATITTPGRVGGL